MEEDENLLLNCGICYGNIELSSNVIKCPRIQCNCIFHPDCLRHWWQYKPQLPSCVYCHTSMQCYEDLFRISFEPFRVQHTHPLMLVFAREQLVFRQQQIRQQHQRE